MKRLIVIGIFLLCTGAIFAQNGVIKELSGTVELKRAGTANFVPAKVGDKIAKDTIVSTGFKSSALITVGSAVITVRPLTRLTLAEISASAGQETLNVALQAGRVRVDVEPPAGTKTNVSVQGPSATASVRGTSFECDTEAVTVLKGVVAYQGKAGGPMLVSAGSTSEVMANGRAADPIDTNAAELTFPPYAGNNTGFHHNSIPDVRGDFEFGIGQMTMH